jgi:hypothetical protein
MKRTALYPMGPAVLVLLLAGCSGSTPSAEASPSAPAATSPAASQPADGNCTTAQVDGSTANAALQSLATEVYASLQCGTSESLPDQLKAMGTDPAIQAKAKDGGITVSVDSAAGGTVMQLTAGTSGCNVTVLDSADAKTMSCLDL